MKRTFDVQVTVSGRITIDDTVLKEARSADWQRTFYPMPTETDVVKHVAFNMLQGRDLDLLDGFAGFSGSAASVKDVEWDDWDVIEIKKGKAL